MNKQELIECETKTLNDKIKKINEIADIPEELGYGLSCPWGDVKYHKDITIDQLGLELHKLRDVLGEYKIGTYWVPYAGTVCVEYMFGKTKVWYRITTENEQGRNWTMYAPTVGDGVRDYRIRPAFRGKQMTLTLSDSSSCIVEVHSILAEARLGRATGGW